MSKEIFTIKKLLLLVVLIGLSSAFLPANNNIYPGTSFHFMEDYDTDSEKGLFDSEEVLNIKLSGSFRELFADRGEKATYHSLVLSYTASDSSEVTLSARAKTRGHFRKILGNCSYPPLMLQFPKTEALKTSIFKGQSKLKLVMPCQGDEYIIREWMVYRLYNLVTPKSFKARLVKVQLEDIKKKKPTAFYGILLEEEQRMAKRNHSVLVDKKMLKPEQMEPGNFLIMAVFQYLIGNTDWSVQYQQNLKILLHDSAAVPTVVPYDFDHSGIVNAPYAKPAEELQLYSVLDRRYRGYCLTDMKQFAGVISLYKQLKKDIYDLYASCPLLEARYVKATRKYFDEFYEIIGNKKEMEKEFSYPCNPNGTGNVVIKGLAKD